jgi:hypothetical protein
MTVNFDEILELDPPHGFLVAQEKQTAIALPDQIDSEKIYLIISNGEAFGTATLEQPAQLRVKEFDLEEWKIQHRITPRERRQWWPDSKMFFVYRLKGWTPFEDIKLYKDGQVIDEPRLTANQWKIISKAKELPKQIVLLSDAVSVSEKQEFIIDLSAKCKELDSILAATYQIDVKEAEKENASELIPLYSLALIRNPRMRVSKKNLNAEGDIKAEKQEGEDMPFGIIEQADEYCVINTETDEVMACHETEEEAEAQLAALRINVEAEEGEAGMHDKPRKRKPHKKEMFGTEQSIDGRLNFIRGQFSERFSTEDNYLWVSDIFESFLITEDDGRLFRVSYIDVNDEIVFALREQWVEVERGYRPKGFKALAIGLKKKEIESSKTEKQAPGFLERLKLAAKNIIDLVSLAETEEAEVKLFMDETGIAQKAINGELWHFTYSTNAFEDRDGEIFSTDALEKYVLQNEKNEEKGYFNLWHINAEDGNFNTDFAQKQWQGVIGRFLVEAGPYLRDEKGRAARKFFKKFGDRHPDIAPEGWGCSPEYKYLPEERASKIYKNIWITRTSTLAKMSAANVWTETRQMRSAKMALSEQQKQAAIAMFGDEFVDTMMQDAEGKTAELEAAGVAHKGSSAEETETEQPAPQEIQLNMDELAAEVGKQFQADLTPIAEAIATMASGIKEMEGRLEKLEEIKQIKDVTEKPRYIFNLQRASEAEATVTDDDGLKNQKPIEAKAKDGDVWSQTFDK